VTLALLAGFMHNRRVRVQGLHGTGKSSHVGPVAARLNWPCARVNIDGHISRLDLVGRFTLPDLGPCNRASHALDLRGGISMAVFGEVLALLARAPAAARA
jgi:hypothetical protein